jgi:pimeloyl-ACP methyl ester carboxylesterase
MAITHLGRRLRRLYPLWLLLILGGCSGLLLRPNAPAPAAPVQLPPGVQLDTGRLASSTGCTFTYRRYRPTQTIDSTAWVVLAHGFLRSQERMQGLAAAMAGAGLQVATLDFCNQRPWAGRHAQNGRDMLALARHLGAQRVLYAGFSAGGLAALLAGRADARAVGILTLDLVDAEGLGVGAARRLDKPLLALAGEPTNCNALDNGQAVFQATAQARVERIRGAGHCDFEAPTDGLCELLCTDPDGPQRSQRGRIIASATGAASALLAANARAWPEQDAVEVKGRDGRSPSSAHLIAR